MTNKVPKRKYKKKSKRVKLVERADEVFSTYVRLKEKQKSMKKFFGTHCPLCETNPIQCCFHWITRTKHIVRWDEDNAIGACNSCNYQMEFNPHPFIRLFIKWNGFEAYEQLIFKSNNAKKIKDKELLSIIEHYERKIEHFLNNQS